jgi:signal transduction histidine kinase
VLAALVFLAYRTRVQRIRGQLNATLAERSRIARELHDTLMQGFSGVTMEMQALSTRLDESPQRQTLQEIIHDAGACLREARRSVAGLRTSNGRASGLADSIAQAARQATEGSNLRLKLRMGDVPANFAPEVQFNLVRIVKEAVTNAVKHSSGRTVEVSLENSESAVVLQISDDGAGLAGNGAAPPEGHYGLVGMRERAAQVGGQLTVTTDAGHGTTICLILPMDRASSGSKAGTMHV